MQNKQLKYFDDQNVDVFIDMAALNMFFHVLFLPKYEIKKILQNHEIYGLV